MRNSLLLLFSLGLPALSAQAQTSPRIFSSDDGEKSLKVLPDAAKASAQWITMDAVGQETVSQPFPLVDMPSRVLVAQHGIDYFATLEDSGQEHTLVLYNGDGSVVRDLKLTDLLTAQEIKDHFANTAQGDSWSKDVTFRFDYPVYPNPNVAGLHLHIGIVVFPRLHLTFPWGKEVFVRLRDGVVSNQNAQE